MDCARGRRVNFNSSRHIVYAFAGSRRGGAAGDYGMRKRIQAHIERLPISYFDSTQTGQLISRIMRDAEGIRNLVGTGLGQIVGGLLSALVSLVFLFYLNWQITIITLVVLTAFGFVLSYAFKQLRPLFRDRGEIEAQVTGRLTEGLGGIRIVKAYTAEKREELSFARNIHSLFRNIAKSLTGVSATGAFASVIIGAIAVVMIYFGGSAVIANIQNPSTGMSSGDFTMYIAFTIFMVIRLLTWRISAPRLPKRSPVLTAFRKFSQ